MMRDEYESKRMNIVYHHLGGIEIFSTTTGLAAKKIVKGAV
jgi:hypothetical protein